MINRTLPVERPPRIKSFNPATLEFLGDVKNCGEEDVKRMVEEARKAFSYWSKISFRERSLWLQKVREYIRKNIDEISEIVANEKGSTKFEATISDVLPIIDLIDFYTSNTERILSTKKINLKKWGVLGKSSYIEFFPYGVIGIISPWNFPFSIPLGQIVIALMAGNTCILKPSELTPVVGLKIGEIFKEVGAPDGIVNILTGDGHTGELLVRSGVNKICFTGSTSTGKKIMAAAAENLIPVALELGGKDPMIVFEDSDIDIATSAAVYGAFFNAGQVCASIERLYIQKKIYDEFLRLMIEKTGKLRIGTENGKADVGAIISSNQLSKIIEHIDEAKSRNAKIHIGGEKANNLKGYFILPTIISGVDNTFKVVRDETFGPVAPIMPFETEEEAIELANDSEYGLTASVWTKDIKRAKRVASQLEFATVMINENLITHALPQTPWGGVKKSGIGRTHGEEGLLEMVQIRHIHINKVGQKIKSPWMYPYTEEKEELINGMINLFYGKTFSEKISGLMKIAKNIKKTIKTQI